MSASGNRLYRSIFLLTVGLLYAATVLRTVLAFRGEPFFGAVLLLLLAWLALFVIDAFVTPHWQGFFPIYVAAQCVILVYLLSRAQSADFYAILFGVLSMQAMQRLDWKAAVLWIALFTPLVALPLTLTNELGQAIAFAVIYTGVDFLLAFFTLSTRRAAEARGRNELLQDELRAANVKIEGYVRKIERLAVTEERHRLARDLHDSVTQTIFSMNLTAQSATLLLLPDPAAADAQLEHLHSLACGALAEIKVLDAELVPPGLGAKGLAEALRRHVRERDVPQGLSVHLVVNEGRGAGGGASVDPLSAREEVCLFRIAQEALNNVVKHAHAHEAEIRLWLIPPCRLEIEDDGAGFDPDDSGLVGMGIDGMRERAREIGWEMRAVSRRGAGTVIVAEQAGDPRGPGEG